MISAEEVLAGLEFLERHADEAFKSAIRLALGACRNVQTGRKFDDVRGRPVDDLELSIRALSALAALGLKTIGDVEQFMRKSDSTLLAEGKRANFGAKSVKEVRAILKDIGLEYRAGGGPS